MSSSFFEWEKQNSILDQKERCFYAVLRLFEIKSQEEVITLYNHKTVSYTQILEGN